MVEVSRKSGRSQRGRMDIIENILRASNGGARKTRIIYQCNLSFRQMHTYLGLLLDMGFLDSTPVKNHDSTSSQLFWTTKKGRDFIEAHHALNVLLTAQPAHQLQITQRATDV